MNKKVLFLLKQLWLIKIATLQLKISWARLQKGKEHKACLKASSYGNWVVQPAIQYKIVQVKIKAKNPSLKKRLLKLLIPCWCTTTWRTTFIWVTRKLCFITWRYSMNVQTKNGGKFCLLLFILRKELMTKSLVNLQIILKVNLHNMGN